MLDKLKEKIQSIRKYYAQIFFVAFFILSFIFLNVFISSTLFIFKVSINAVTVILSFFLSAWLNIYLLNKKKLLDKNKILNILATIVLPIVIILASLYINGKVLDYTWDGNSYQKATTGLLASGWNPLYEHLEEFDAKSRQSINIRDESPVYINHYPRAASIFSANIYKLTGNIECGKAINTLGIIMVFLFTISFFMYKKKSIIFTLLFSICTITYSVVCVQFLTNYIDLLVYIFLYLLFYCFFAFEEDDFILQSKELLVMYFMILTISINIKISLFGYVGIFGFSYYIWYIYRLIKKKKDKKFFWQFTVASTISVIMGVLVIGLSVYPKNLIEHGHPFYPLMGEGKVEIMEQNQPYYFRTKSALEKFIIATFSKTEDIIAVSKDEAEYKIPFTFSQDEINNVSAPDIRISGNGVLFSGILIISIIIIGCRIKNVFKFDKKQFIMYVILFGVTLLMIFFFNESWWARYFPQIYLVVLASILILDNYDKKIWIKVFKYIFIFIILTNNFITFSGAIKRAYQKNVVFNTEFTAFENANYNEDNTLILYTKAFHGAKYNILDKYGKYNIIFKSDYSDKTGTEKKFFDGFLEWRCEK